jgi:L-cysteine:1D-myo-inositol 2-amino-2-deoxy-alpha-D-glucopyranoside ligase
MYVCGITPYDATHLGHAATYVAFDVLNRAWLDAGHDVAYTQNVTDVDDPLLERAAELGVSWRELADEQTRLFAYDMAWLRVLPPRHFVGVVESIPLIIDVIQRMRELSVVYELDGDTYFSVRSDPRFGDLSGLDDASMRALSAERGGDPNRPGKKDVLDCVVWQHSRPGEPAWDSPFGPGRPGWHVECMAIALHYLGAPFDVQGGGSDLMFPHHEMTASHGHVMTGKLPFAKNYLHSGLVSLDGQPMSKSLGNLVFVSDLRRAGVDPAAIRLALLSQHYRATREWTDDLLAAGIDRLTRWRMVAAAPAAPDAAALLADVRQHVANDLDTPAAIGVIDDWVQRTMREGGTDPTAPTLFRSMTDALLGIAVFGE